MASAPIRAEQVGPRPAVTPGGGKPVVKTADFKAAMARAREAGTAAPAGPQFAARAEPRPDPRTDPRAAARAAAQAESLLRQASAGPASRAAMPRLPAEIGTASLRARLAAAEGSTAHPNNGYHLRNASSDAMGRYQLTPVALQDIGWRDGAGNWTARAGALGVRGDGDFLSSPAAQEAAMTDYLKRIESQLSAQGSLAASGTSLTGTDGQAVPVTHAGLLAAAHRRGAGAVARWLQHRTATPEAPVPPAQRAVFASIEGRLRSFADLPASARVQA
jgi:hypothetical protein